MKKSQAIAVVFCLVAFTTGLVLQAGLIRDVKRGDTSSPAQEMGLTERVPTELNGWRVRDEPLGPTEFLKSAVEQNLNYDDMVNRIYQNNDTTLGVYVAYWSPGRMPVQKVASHTPDRCWSENGWSCREFDRITGLTVGEDGPEITPAQWRVFQPPQSEESTYVMYWHLVGGDLYDYGEGLNKSLGPIAWWKETLHYAFKGSAEQYFIRLTSNRSFEEIWNEPGVEEIVAALAKLGLAERSEVESQRSKSQKVGDL